jgi:hypothetical protein
MRVFMTGATGLIGRAVAAALAARGDRVVALTRGAGGAAAAIPGAEMVVGDPAIPGDWMAHVGAADVVINLAGESIGAGRLDPPHLARVRESRLGGTANLVRAIAEAPAARRPRVLASASGADFYPFDSSDRAWTEQDGNADTALALLCAEWESAARAAEAHGVRVALMRTGIVLAPGPALARMSLPFRLFAGGPVGTGRQWFSWIGLGDAVGAILLLVRRDEAAGPFNLVSPEAARQKAFARALGEALHRPSWLPVPALAVRAAAGGLADYILNGRRVVPAALAALGYGFRAPDLRRALAEAVGG